MEEAIFRHNTPLRGMQSRKNVKHINIIQAADGSPESVRRLKLSSYMPDDFKTGGEL